MPAKKRGSSLLLFKALVVRSTFIAGSVAHVIGVSWAIGGGALIMLAYSYWAFERKPELQEL